MILIIFAFVVGMFFGLFLTALLTAGRNNWDDEYDK